MKRKILSKLFLLVLGTAAMAAWAAIGESAQPTSAERTAIRNACQSDFMKYCSAVKPGGAEALACLQKNLAVVSVACQTAVGAVSGNKAGTSNPPGNGSGATTKPAAQTPAPATTEPAQKVVVVAPLIELRIIRNACARDYRILCGAVPLGGGRAVGCLRQHAPSLSPGCKGALSKL